MDGWDEMRWPSLTFVVARRVLARQARGKMTRTGGWIMTIGPTLTPSLHSQRTLFRLASQHRQGTMDDEDND